MNIRHNQISSTQKYTGLPRWLSAKESICQCRRPRFHPWVRKISWRRKWQRSPVFLPGKSHGQRSKPDGLQSMGSQRVGYDWPHMQCKIIHCRRQKLCGIFSPSKMPKLSQFPFCNVIFFLLCVFLYLQIYWRLVMSCTWTDLSNHIWFSRNHLLLSPSPKAHHVINKPTAQREDLRKPRWTSRQNVLSPFCLKSPLNRLTTPGQANRSRKQNIRISGVNHPHHQPGPEPHISIRGGVGNISS